MKQITIFKDKNLYSSFPLLDYISDNEIVTGFFTAPRPDHCGIYDWRVMLSTNQGETWTETHDKKYKFNDTEFRPRYLSDSFKTQDGRVGSFGFAFSRKGLQMSNCISISKNNNFSRISIPGIKYLFSFPRFFQHDDVIMIPMYAILKNDKETPLIYLSYNNGQNWQLHKMFPDNIEGSEYALIKLTSGQMMAVIRSDKYPLLQSFSDDYGRTWSYPICTNMIGNPSHLLRLQDGKILCSYGYRNQLNSDGIAIIASYSNDEGEFWYPPKVLQLSNIYSSSLHKTKLFEKKPNGVFDSGYPVSIQLSNGDILTVYYITHEDRITHIEATKWRLDD